jgi:outer membrane murein-binding lipoprotein Lpp
MKTTIIATIMALIFLAGCQQVQDIQKTATEQIENTKTQVIQTKDKIDEKVKQVNEAATAIDNLTK